MSGGKIRGLDPVLVRTDMFRGAPLRTYRVGAELMWNSRDLAHIVCPEEETKPSITLSLRGAITFAITRAAEGAESLVGDFWGWFVREARIVSQEEFATAHQQVVALMEQVEASEARRAGAGAPEVASCEAGPEGEEVNRVGEPSSVDRGAVTPRVFLFEGITVTPFEWNGRQALTSADLGRLCGFAHAADVTRLYRNRPEDFVRGVDYEILEGEELRQFKAQTALKLSVDPRVRSFTIWFEPGAYMATMLAETEQGRRARRWLADEVFPSLARTGSYTAPSAAPSATPDPELVARIDHLERLIERILALYERLALSGGVSSVIDPTPVLDPEPEVGDDAEPVFTSVREARMLAALLVRMEEMELARQIAVPLAHRVIAGAAVQGFDGDALLAWAKQQTGPFGIGDAFRATGQPQGKRREDLAARVLSRNGFLSHRTMVDGFERVRWTPTRHAA